MDTQTLCLSVLALHEASGYEIKKIFEQRHAYFQQVGFGSIYPALTRLSEAGYVTCQEQAQLKRPTKKVFRITAEGLRHFKEVLRTTPSSEDYRSDFLFLVFYAHLLTTEELQTVLDQQIHALQTQIDALMQKQQLPDLNGGMKFTIDFGISAKQARLDFILAHRANLLAQHKTEALCQD